MQADPHSSAAPGPARSYGPAASWGGPVDAGHAPANGQPVDPFAYTGAPVQDGAHFATGAYQPSGNPFIDRMLQLEQALKLNATSW